jgi:diacylglycerol kinase (ATP)
MESQLAQPRKALLLASPHMYEERLTIETACGFFRQYGVDITHISSVEMLDHQPPMGKHWKAEGLDVVIAAGGDGSVGAAATHLAYSDLPLGILPLGTSNDFARSLRLPLELAEACQTIAGGRVINVDLGRARPALTEPYALHEDAAEGAASGSGIFQGEAFFTHALTLGLNVAFAQLATNATMRQRFGPLTYPVAALETLAAAQPLDFTLSFQNPACSLAPETSETEIEERPYRYQALQVAVINSPIFGGQFAFSVAGVELYDRLLDILIIERFDPRQLLAALQAALAPSENGWREANSKNFPGIHHIQAGGVTIATDKPVDVTLDGEIRGRTPIEVTSAARALNVIVPQASDVLKDRGAAGG